MSIKKKIKNTIMGIFVLICVGIAVLLYVSRDGIKATPSTIESLLGSFYDSEKMGGFAVSVFSKDSILYSKGFGYSDIEKKIPYTTKTQQYIASVSKTTIGISLLKAQELGLLKITDDINIHLPFEVKNPNFPDAAISIEHLATHTSSLDYNETVVESLYINELEKNRLLLPFMENYFDNKTYGEVLFTNNLPGEHWNYSNIGAALAAYIIEHTSGMSYTEFTKTHIFEPLNMKNTHWFESHADSSDFTSYYEPIEKGGIKKVKNKGVILYPVRDMHTNVEDLTLYGQAMLQKNSNLLSKKSYELMFNKKIKSSVSGREYDNQGVFWMIDRNLYGIAYSLTGHGGGDYCINTMFWFDPKTELGYILVGNTGQSEANWSNQVRIYNSLVSLGDYAKLNNSKSSFTKKISHRLYNAYSRVNSAF